jgi:alpha-N-arabinofuranosidase
MCAEGGTSVDHREVIFKGDAPMGTFKPWENNPILTQKHLDGNRPLPVTCAGHADLVQKKNGEWWSVFLACRPLNNQFENLGRETFLMPVKWTEDGYPLITEGEEVVPRVLQMEGATRSEDVTFGNFEKIEEFESEKLGDEWMTLRGPASAFYSLSDKPGFLTLKCIDANASELKELALVSRRLQHHKFEIVSTLYFNPEAEDAAGLLLLKDEGHQYFISIRKGEEGRKISVEKISFKESEILGSLNISEDGPVTLKIVSDGLTFSFFAVGDTEDMPIAEGVDARYLSTANSFGFTGTTIGLYATKNL